MALIVISNGSKMHFCASVIDSSIKTYIVIVLGKLSEQVLYADDLDLQF